MTKEDIINEYIPFMVKLALRKGAPPKGEKELTQFSQELGKHVIERVENPVKVPRIITESERELKRSVYVKDSKRIN